MSVKVTDFDPATQQPRSGHYINGQWLPGVAAVEVRRPSDGAVYGDLPDAGAEVVDAAVRAAQAALKSSGWATCAPRERARVMSHSASVAVICRLRCRRWRRSK